VVGGLAVLLAGGVALTACGSGSGGKTASRPMTNSGSSPGQAALAQTAPATPTIGLADNAKVGQKILVDSMGRTLYLFVPDGTGSATQVPAQFKANWPQLTTAAPVAGAGLDMTKLAVHTQTDGARQVAYNGHLLYTFIHDTAPGDTNGQGLGPNNWFVLDANGNPIGLPSAPAAVSLAPNAKVGQKILVDSMGRTLYLFVPDGTGSQTQVPAQFKANWPQLTTAAPMAGAGLDMTKLAVHTQTDGARQVAYNGHLLYTFIHDTAPGDTNGQALGPNNWFVLDAHGNAIGLPRQAPVPPTSAPAMSPSGGTGWKGW
jgi:predicted lipoprotein with Yx(FWY)xxD motif